MIFTYLVFLCVLCFECLHAVWELLLLIPFAITLLFLLTTAAAKYKNCQIAKNCLKDDVFFNEQTGLTYDVACLPSLLPPAIAKASHEVAVEAVK